MMIKPNSLNPIPTIKNNPMTTRHFFIVAVSSFLFLSCTQQAKNGKATAEQGAVDGEMAKELNERKVQFEAAAPEELKRVYDEGIRAVEESGVLSKAINRGDKAPDFILKDHLGNNVILSHEYEKGPVILVWYRGGWCPYCNINLRYLQESLPQFTELGATLIAITPEVADSSLSTQEKLDLNFSVLSDTGNKVARSYGVVFKLSKELAEKYQAAFNLHKYNGDTSDELPLATTYLIDKKGIVQYAFLDADYRKRAEPSDILKELKRITK
jgi:Peroxiredoxin